MHSSISPIDQLDDECNAMDFLLTLIKQEQQCLIEANIENLAKTTEEKTKVIAKISELAETRHQALVLAGYGAGDASMQAWLENTSNVAANAKWSQLIGIAHAAKELNRTNGLLINQHLTRNRNALNVLQGTNDSENFYGPNGHSTKKSSQRRLVIG